MTSPAPARSGGSKTGMIVALVLGGGAVLAVAAIAAVWFFVIKPRQQPTPPVTIAESTLATQPPQTQTESTLAPSTAPPETLASTTPDTTPTTTLRVADNRVPPPQTLGVPPPPPTTRAQDPPIADSGFGALDREPPNLDGREGGEEISGTYGQSDSNRNFGSKRPLRARPRIPHGISMPERRAAFNLLNMMRFQEAYKRKTGRYGTFRDTLPMSVPQANVLQNAGYKFELSVESDGFRIVATPVTMSGLRPLVGDDSGFVLFADE
jgi:hypothetical protein